MSDSIARLKEIDHIVMLLMENRSFDTMLGFLSMPRELGGRGRTDIDGLRDTDKFQNTYQGKTYRPEPLSEYPRFWWDPDHTHAGIVQQLSVNNGGFVESFVTNHDQLCPSIKLEEEQYGLVMGYHTAQDVWVYDHLAEQYCVCDRWFSCVRGSTIPNRLYAMAGTSGGKTDNPTERIPKAVDLNSIFQILKKGAWKNYISDFSSLWLLKQYRRKLWRGPIDELGAFWDDARKGDLPPLSWIDSNYSTKTRFGSDDHPPANIFRGQNLVGEIYNALLAGPKWEKTLFVITYDEHGGFYDHVKPPRAADDDRYPDVQQYGVRVPAIVVSPWIEGGTSSVTFDHTSVLKTILLRFASQPDGSIPSMTKRIDAAQDLSVLFREAGPRQGFEPVKVFSRDELDERDEFHHSIDLEDTKLNRLWKGIQEDVERHV